MPSRGYVPRPKLHLGTGDRNEHQRQRCYQSPGEEQTSTADHDRPCLALSNFPVRLAAAGGGYAIVL